MFDPLHSHVQSPPGFPPSELGGNVLDIAGIRCRDFFNILNNKYDPFDVAATYFPVQNFGKLKTCLP